MQLSYLRGVVVLRVGELCGPRDDAGKGSPEVHVTGGGHQEARDTPHGQSDGLAVSEVTERHEYPLLHQGLTALLHAALKHLR